MYSPDIRKFPNHVPVKILFAVSNFPNLPIVSPAKKNAIE